MLLRRRIARLFVGYSLLLAVISFIYGAVMVHGKIFPYNLLKNFANFLAESQLEPQYWKMYLKIRPTRHLQPTDLTGQGVLVNETSAVQPGFTLLSGLFDDSGTTVRLIDNSGNLVHRWKVSYSALWPRPDHLSKTPFNDWFANIHGAILLPDGSIVFNLNYLGSSRLDRCGNLLWNIAQETHHAVFLSDDGTIWVPSRKYHEANSRSFAKIKSGFYEDVILQISVDGEILREISIINLIYKNQMGGLLQTGTGSTIITNFDPLHLNDVEILSAKQSPAFPSLRPGVVMVSLRNPNLVLIFDPDTEEILWHQTGPWLHQHDPDFRDDGLISVFDNRSGEDNEDAFDGSRILLVDPVTHRTSEAYPRRPENRFFTSTRGKHQNLANGNILLAESEAGRVLEIAKDGRVVWSYLNRYDESSVGIIYDAIRYPETHTAAMANGCDGS